MIRERPGRKELVGLTGNTTTWVLPKDVAIVLLNAYSDYRTQVNARAPRDAKWEALLKLAVIAKAGREKGWPYPEMASACEMTPERLRQIVAAMEKEHPQQPVDQVLADQFPTYAPPPQRKAPQARRPRKTRRSRLTDAERKRLQTLAPLARQTSGSTPLSSPIRKATRDLSKMIIRLHDRGVIWKDLAEATGLSESGVRSRAGRHGYHGGPPPSIPPYRGTTIYREAKARKREANKNAAA